jgi:adenylate kinase
MDFGPRLLLFGRQGSGKGTQAQLLARHFGINHLSTGKFFRDSAAVGVPAGLEAKAFMDRGEFVPDDIVIAVVEERFANPTEISQGFILDGFPRNENQARELDRILGEHSIDVAINLDVPYDLCVERMLDRGRHDDTDDGIKRRLDLYEAETEPLLHFYRERDLLEMVDGVGDPDDICKRLIEVVDQRLSRLDQSLR